MGIGCNYKMQVRFAGKNGHSRDPIEVCIHELESMKLKMD